jgi:membrane-associated phospholipid phosphatase
VVAARRGPAFALPLGATPVVAHFAHQLARQAVGRRRPLHALLVGKRSPSFPSGHAMRSSAVAFAVAYALVRENVAPGRFVVPIAVALPAAAGISRAYADVHWATDVLGGWGLGAAVGAGAALCHEWLRRDVAR